MPFCALLSFSRFLRDLIGQQRHTAVISTVAPPSPFEFQRDRCGSILPAKCHNKKGLTIATLQDIMGVRVLNVDLVSRE